ncbi:uncharacterized protein LOC143289443 [Babylonia areolata]|uniref:uncharacterized protein LOC143289441 n=1 Tax=Babylonia areolata TaxID=304850 RepID=UPI003FD06C5A
MAFSVSYHDLLDKNIRHIYSGLPSNVRFRGNPRPGVTLNPHDGCVTPSSKRRPEVKAMPRSLYRRLWTYSDQYSCPLPRAPALRSVSPARARVIVQRVSQMTSTHRQRQPSHGDDDDDDAESSYVSSRSSTPLSCCSQGTGTTGTGTGTEGTSTPSSRSSSADSERWRLGFLMRPTVSWSIRSDLREGSVLDPVKVVHRRTGVTRYTQSIYM